MSAGNDDPRCPECGEPIGQQATYCMHCSADLTQERQSADTDGDGDWDRSGGVADTDTGTAVDSGDSLSQSPGSPVQSGASTASDDQLLDPEGIVDNSLTALVALGAGLFIGFLSLIVVGIITGSPIALPIALLAWVASTAHLWGQRTVQGAVEKSGYAVAILFLALPLVALTPVQSYEGGLSARLISFVGLFAGMLVPASIAAGIGYFASWFVPEDRTKTA